MYVLQNVPRQNNLTCCQLLNKIHDMGVLNFLRFDLTFANDFQKSLMIRTIKTSMVYQSTVILAVFFTENNYTKYVSYIFLATQSFLGTKC